MVDCVVYISIYFAILINSLYTDLEFKICIGNGSSDKAWLSLDTWVKFRQKLGSV